MKDELEARIGELEARIALLEADKVSPFLPYIPTYPQPWYDVRHTWDVGSTDASGWTGDTVVWKGLPVIQLSDNVQRFTVIDGELRRVLDDSPPGMAPLPADAGILHVRD